MASGGYDFKFLQDIPDEYLCALCYYVIKDPVMPESCGHAICSGCQKTAQESM